MRGDVERKLLANPRLEEREPYKSLASDGQEDIRVRSRNRPDRSGPSKQNREFSETGRDKPSVFKDGLRVLTEINSLQIRIQPDQYLVIGYPRRLAQIPKRTGLAVLAADQGDFIAGIDVLMACDLKVAVIG